MDNTVEKSCWGITLWTIAIVLVAGLILSFFFGGAASVAAGSAVVISG